MSPGAHFGVEMVALATPPLLVPLGESRGWRTVEARRGPGHYRGSTAAKAGFVSNASYHPLVRDLDGTRSNVTTPTMPLLCPTGVPSLFDWGGLPEQRISRHQEHTSGSDILV